MSGDGFIWDGPGTLGKSVRGAVNRRGRQRALVDWLCVVAYTAQGVSAARRYWLEDGAHDLGEPPFLLIERVGETTLYDVLPGGVELPTLLARRALFGRAVALGEGRGWKVRAAALGDVCAALGLNARERLLVSLRLYLAQQRTRPFVVEAVMARLHAHRQLTLGALLAALAREDDDREAVLDAVEVLIEQGFVEVEVEADTLETVLSLKRG